MNIFILEDDQVRIQWLRERLFAHTCTFIESSTQADQFVGPYDLVLLDHDLGGRQLEDHEDDGLAFVKAVKDRIGGATVIVHSYNQDGAFRMLAELDLPLHHYMPFRGPQFKTALDRIERNAVMTTPFNA